MDKRPQIRYLWCVVFYVVPKNRATTFAQLNRVAPFLLARSQTDSSFEQLSEA